MWLWDCWIFFFLLQYSPFCSKWCHAKGPPNLQTQLGRPYNNAVFVHELVHRKIHSSSILFLNLKWCLNGFDCWLWGVNWNTSFICILFISPWGPKMACSIKHASCNTKGSNKCILTIVFINSAPASLMDNLASPGKL